MTQYFDDFSSYSAGDLSSVGSANWTVHTLSGDWSVVVNTTAGPGSTAAVVADSVATGNAESHCYYTASATSGDIEVYARFTNAGTYVTNIGFGPVLIQSDDAAYGLSANGTTQARLIRFSTAGAASAVIGSAFSFTLTASTLYHVVIARSGTTISAKIWADGDSEPGSPQASGTDTNLTTVAGGIFAFSFSMAPQTTDLFGVGTAGDSAPRSGGGGGSSIVPIAMRHYRQRRMM